MHTNTERACLIRRVATMAVAALVIAACGGGGDQTEPATTDPPVASATDPPATGPPATEPAEPPPTTEPASPPVTEPTAPETEPPAPEPEPAGQLGDVQVVNSPVAPGQPYRGLGALSTFGDTTVVTYGVLAFVLDTPGGGQGSMPTPISLPDWPATCPEDQLSDGGADPAICGPDFAGFDPVAGCLLVGISTGPLRCYDIGDPAAPTLSWEIPLCADGVIEKDEWSKQCRLDQVVTVGERLVASTGGGALASVRSDGEDRVAECRTQWPEHEITMIEAVSDNTDRAVVSRRNIFDGTKDAVVYDFTSCEVVTDDAPIQLHGFRAVQAGGSFWSLERNESNVAVLINGDGEEFTLADSHAPWATPRIVSNGTTLFAQTVDEQNEGTVWRIDPDQPGDPVPITDVPAAFLGGFAADGRLVVGDDAGNLQLYAVTS